MTNRYFYIDHSGQQKGTYSPEELKLENIKKDTLVWTQGMSDWKRASEVSELSFLFDNSNAQQQTVPPIAPSGNNGGEQQYSPQDILDKQLAPVMNLKEWMITYLILMIPLVNIIMLFIWAFGSNNENPNKVNWAKANLIWMAIGIVLYIVFVGLLIAAIGSLSGLGEVFGGSEYVI